MGSVSRDAVGDARGPVTAAIARGEYLQAYDEALRRLARRPDLPERRYQLALALTSAGATTEAVKALRTAGFDGAPHDAVRPELREDIDELRARLAMDEALGTSGPKQVEAARGAALRYERLFEGGQGTRNGLDAAVMWLLAGERLRARRTAKNVLDLSGAQNEASDAGLSWGAIAEALLLLDDRNGVRQALEQASGEPDFDLRERADLRRRLLLVCELLPADPVLLLPVAPPIVLHYCGHRIGVPGQGRFPAEDEPDVAGEIAAYVAQKRIGFAYGSLADGADILCAEALLQRGVELNVVLPFAMEEFVRESVLPAGRCWVDRFHDCLGAATSVTYVTKGGYLGDDTLYALASAVAMGGALLRGHALTADVAQLAVWDGEATDEPAGTAHDVHAWRQLGLTSDVIAIRHSSGEVKHSSRNPATPPSVPVTLVALASHEATVRVAATLDRFRDQVLAYDVSDGLVRIVMTWPVVAARCALALQEAVHRVAAETDRPSESPTIRIVADVGPRGASPAARGGGDEHLLADLEALRGDSLAVPPGQVYVTERLAALLMVEPGLRVRCQRVGHMPRRPAADELLVYVLKAKR